LVDATPVAEVPSACKELLGAPVNGLLTYHTGDFFLVDESVYPTDALVGGNRCKSLDSVVVFGGDDDG